MGGCLKGQWLLPRMTAPENKLNRVVDLVDLTRGCSDRNMPEISSQCLLAQVRHVIPRPQDCCTTVTGYKQPTYDDLNVFQGSQGFVYWESQIITLGKIC